MNQASLIATGQPVEIISGRSDTEQEYPEYWRFWLTYREPETGKIVEDAEVSFETYIELTS